MKVHNIPSLNPLQLFRPSHAQQQQQPQPRAGLVAEQRPSMPKVPSLLFEIELEEGPTRPEVTEDADTQGVLTNFQSLAVPWSETEHELLAEWKASSDAQHSNIEALNGLAARLRKLGHPVSIRTALGGGWGGECLRNLRHSFLVCTVDGSEGTAAYIIDPAFREQFSVAHPTARYEQILNAVPAVYVGTEERLVALVKAICHELQGVFLEQNATLPPWRDVAAQLSKWRPRRSTDLAVLQEEPGKQKQHHGLPTLHITASAASAAPPQQQQPQSQPGMPPVTQPRGLARTSAPAFPPSSTALGFKGSDAAPSTGSGLGGSGKSLMQRMAGPVQHFVSRSSSQSGLFMSGL